MRNKARLVLSPLLLAAGFLLMTCPSFALDNGLAKTPPMGWNSWNKLGATSVKTSFAKPPTRSCQRHEDAQAINSVVIDDCWQVSRDKEGNIVPIRSISHPALRSSQTTFIRRA